MHILELPSFFPPYGGAFCLEQSKALHRLGHEVRIVSRLQLGIRCGWRDYMLRPFATTVGQMEGIEVWRNYQRGIPRVIRPNVDRWLKGVEQLAEAYRRQHGRPDIIHAHGVKWAGRAAMKLSEGWSVPFVITEHLSSMLYAQELGDGTAPTWQTSLLREALKRAACVVTVADEQVGDLAPYFGTDYVHQTISNIVDTDFFYPIVRQRTDTFRYCAVGHFSPIKGYDLLAEAFRMLQRQGVKASLTLVGQGTDKAACRRLFADLTDVCFLGATDKEGVRQVLHASDALVLPTRSEAQPLVLLEAMSTGMPVVTTDAVPQQVRQFHGCLTVPKNQATPLADAIQRVAQESFSPQQTAKEIARNCSPSVVGKQLERLFLSVV